MTDKQHDEILAQFRQQLVDDDVLHEGDTIGTDDDTLLRFLRARHFNLAQAKKMFTDCQNWRKTVKMDDIYKEIDPFDYPEREAVFESWPMWFHKTDKKGRPLNIQSFGDININNLYKACTPERHWQIFLVNAECLTREVLPAASRAAGEKVNTAFVIVDLKGFGLSSFWQIKSLVRGCFQVSQDYYPETMGQLAIINAPSSFAFIWSAVKPWLAKETVEKVDILGSNYQQVLLNLVHEENLPAQLGGKCTCDDVGGCHLSGAGPWQDGRVGWRPKVKEMNVLAMTTEGSVDVLEEDEVETPEEAFAAAQSARVKEASAAPAATGSQEVLT